MLFVLAVCALVALWVGLVVAICAICAAGGAADDRSEEWYAEQRRVSEGKDDSERGAA
jgi:gamma-glutamylcysteine synthetase